MRAKAIMGIGSPKLFEYWSSKWFFPSFQMSTLGGPVSMIASDFYFLLTEVEPNKVFSCFSPFTSRSNVWSMLKCFSAHQNCTESLFILLYLPGCSNQSGHFSLTFLTNKEFSPTELMLAQLFSFSHHFE